jgi:rRNA maturation protein Nop10
MPVKTCQRWTSALLLAAGVWGACAAEAWLAGAQVIDGTARAASPAAGPTAFVCPMHPDYTLDVAGSCPRCGMALVKATPFDVRNYRVDVKTAPARLRAGQPARWTLRVFRPDSDEPVTRFETVHERQYHLFVVSHDMAEFQHIHPEPQADGSWALDVTRPKAR